MPESEKMPQGQAAYSAKRVVRNTLLLTTGRLFGAPVSLLQVGLAAHYLRVADYGAYVYLFTYLAIFGTLADFGINQILVREQSRPTQSFDNLLVTGFVAKLLLAFLAIASALLFSHFGLLEEDKRIYLYFASVMLASAALNVFGTYFDVNLRGEFPALVNLASGVGLCVTTWAVVKFHGGLFGLVLLNILFGFPGFSSVLPGVVTVVTLASVSGRCHRIIWSVGWSRVWAVLRESAPLGASLGLTILATRADSILLTRIRGAEQMGFYAAITRLTDTALVIPSFFAASLLPKFSSEFSICRERFIRNLRRSSELVSMGGTICFLFVYIFADSLIEVIFGARFAPSAMGLKIMAMVLWLVTANGILCIAAVSSGHQKLNLWCGGVSLFASVTLNLMLIPQFGFLGSCLARVASEFLVFLVALGYLDAAYSQPIGSPVILSGLLVIGSTVVVSLFFPTQTFSTKVSEVVLLVLAYSLVLHRLRPLRLHELQGIATF